MFVASCRVRSSTNRPFGHYHSDLHVQSKEFHVLVALRFKTTFEKFTIELSQEGLALK